MKTLSSRPHLGHLGKQAKQLLDGYRRNDSEALERFRNALPAAADQDHEAIAAMSLRLHDAQSCVAREYGFASWAQLRDEVDLRAASLDTATRRHQWQRWALGYGYQPAKPRLAARLLRDHPDVLVGEPVLACAVGDTASVRAAIAADPSWAQLARAADGMAPLVSACFSALVTLPEHARGIRECVAMLLQAGADPNATWTNPLLPSEPLSALFGAAGRNHDAAITAMLLQAGANPNDNESLYHATEASDPALVELLLDAGARVSGTNALFRCLDFERPKTLRLLLAHGGDANESGPGGSPLAHAIRRRRSLAVIDILLHAGADPAFRNVHGVSVYRMARCLGLSEVAERLLEAGATSENGANDAFLSACARADAGAVQTMLADDPGLIDRLSAAERKLLPELAANGCADAVRMMVEAGWPIAERGGDIDGSALNQAVFRGDSELAAFLLEHGARYDERHGYNDNVYGTLSFASIARTQPDGDWLGCAVALIDSGAPLPETRYDFAEEVAAFFQALRG